MKNKFAQFFAIEKRMRTQGYDGTRSGLIMEFTHDRKNSLRELSDTEYRVFILWLQQTFPESLNEPYPQSKEAAQCDLMRKKMIHLFRTIGYNEAGSADMERIYAWVLKYGYLKKRLMEYNSAELPKLVSQVEKYYNSTLE